MIASDSINLIGNITNIANSVAGTLSSTMSCIGAPTYGLSVIDSRKNKKSRAIILIMDTWEILMLCGQGGQ